MKVLTTLPVEGSIESTCPGNCCDAFHLDLKTLHILKDKPGMLADGPYVKDMLIWITPEEARDRHRKFGWFFRNWEPVPGEFYFTCKHFDRETRLCKAYDKRPKMCRDYPEGKCKHGCGING